MGNIKDSEKLCLIVLTDFSAAADNATLYARDLAIALNAQIHLVHIWDNSILNPGYFLNSHPYNSEKKIENALQQKSRELGENLAVKPVLLKGTITDKLPAYLKNMPNTLVIIGKRFTENTPDEMVSSTSVHLLDIEGISLLIIPERFTAESLPAKIGFGWDGQSFALKNAIFAHLFNSLNAELLVIHVARDEDNIDAEKHLDISQELLGIETENATLDIAEGKSVAGLIHARSAINQVDLLTFIIRKRPFLNQLFHASISAAFIRHAATPLLILHG